eukprot:CAMPEP_0180643626 /NCGR_PEP_ID=MMETSP1037_2-20121125/47928_1 /TAXON_ID=632150 /ORGANISM="Azadinium spinosum, Strain 3D9" /LENGTH=42 /DNA_ID= /DNA_START= /DNA_END= /DNA_ORIENTATION=
MTLSQQSANTLRITSDTSSCKFPGSSLSGRVPLLLLPYPAWS